MIAIYTYQDFLDAKDRLNFISAAIADHRRSADCEMARIAELYDKQQNVTINAVVRYIYKETGAKVVDPTVSNNKIASNFFHRLNTQRVSYLLGNGISFIKHIETIQNADGTPTKKDATKETLGEGFDRNIYDIVYSGEISGKSYCYVTWDHREGYKFHLFPFTEFVPLLDEYDGTLKAGIRYWSLEWGKRPVTAVLYEASGRTVYRTRNGRSGLSLEEYEPKRKYNLVTAATEAHGTEIIGDENRFSDLPIIPYYGANETSTLVGLRGYIDAHDAIMSGFANDLQDVAQIYWLISGGGMGSMDDNRLKQFRERLLFQHVAIADLENGQVQPYSQNVPCDARMQYLKQSRNAMYEGFGGLDVTNINPGDRTATEIEAAYSALDEEADALEGRTTDFIKRVLKLLKIDDVPQYKRNRIANQLEQTQMVIMAAEYLSKRAILDKLPWVTVDEIDTILAELAGEVDETREDDDGGRGLDGDDIGSDEL